MPSKRNIFLTSIFRGEKVCLVSNGSKALRAGSSLSALFLVITSSLKLRITGQHDTRPSLYHCRVITTSSVAGGPVIRGTLRSANQISYAFRSHKKAPEQTTQSTVNRWCLVQNLRYLFTLGEVRLHESRYESRNSRYRTD